MVQSIPPSEQGISRQQHIVCWELRSHFLHLKCHILDPSGWSANQASSSQMLMKTRAVFAPSRSWSHFPITEVPGNKWSWPWRPLSQEINDRCYSFLIIGQTLPSPLLASHFLPGIDRENRIFQMSFMFPQFLKCFTSYTSLCTWMPLEIHASCPPESWGWTRKCISGGSFIYSTSKGTEEWM